MTILSLDIGTQMGWAKRDWRHIISSGSLDLRGSHAGVGVRFKNFRQWLKTMDDVDDVYFERVMRHAGTTAAHVYGGFLGVLFEWCESENVSCYGVPVKTIKKFITGNGNAGKELVIAGVRSRGFNPFDHNEADALALLLLVMDKEKATEKVAAGVCG